MKYKNTLKMWIQRIRAMPSKRILKEFRFKDLDRVWALLQFYLTTQHFLKDAMSQNNTNVAVMDFS